MMKDAQVLFDLLMTNPLVGVAIASIAVVFTVLLRVATVAAEILTKRWLAPAPVPPIFPNDPNKVEDQAATLPTIEEEPRKFRTLKLPFVVVLLGGLVATLIVASLSVDTFQGRDANGEVCVGTRLFGLKNAACSEVTTHFEGIEGF